MKMRWLCYLLLAFCLAGCGATQEAIDREQRLQEAAELHEDALQGVIDAQKELKETFGNPLKDSDTTPHIYIGPGEEAYSERLKVTFLDFWTQNQIDTYYDGIAPEGYTFVVIAFRIDNISAEDVLFYWRGIQFYADGVEYNSSVSIAQPLPRINGYSPMVGTLIDDPGTSGERTISSGRAIEGYVVCDIPSDTETFEMEFDEFILTCDVPH